MKSKAEYHVLLNGDKKKFMGYDAVVSRVSWDKKQSVVIKKTKNILILSKEEYENFRSLLLPYGRFENSELSNVGIKNLVPYSGYLLQDTGENGLNITHPQ